MESYFNKNKKMIEDNASIGRKVYLRGLIDELEKRITKQLRNKLESI
ncbi:hypothetical protein LR010_02160 [Candidatus Gracilibacteria bacterium]|nr:hypothetical protein [Candidatus Gracilibacteria bacterium]